MATASVQAGTKLYSYCYGPMTVTARDDKYLYAKADDLSEAAGTIQKYDSLTPEHCFLLSSIGHWVFLDAKDVGCEDNNFPHASTSSNTLEVDPNLAHPMFQSRFPNPDSGKDRQPVEKLSPVVPADQVQKIPGKPSKITVMDTQDEAGKSKGVSSGPSKITLAETDSDLTPFSGAKPSKITVLDTPEEDVKEAKGRPSKITVVDEDE